MIKNYFIKTFIIFLILSSNLFALPKDSIKDEMTKRIDNVLSILEKKDLPFNEKGKEIINIMDDTFDFELMAKIALGKESWSSIGEEKQDEFTKVFEEKIKKSYVDKFELYNDQKVKIISLEPHNKTRLQLKTELIGKEGNYEVNYNFYEKNSDWLIYDVDLLGVSIIQTYRQQFSGLLKEKSFDEMLEQFKNQ